MICEDQQSVMYEQQQQQQMNSSSNNFSVFSALSFGRNSETRPHGYYGQLVNQYISLSKQNLNDETCSAQAIGYQINDKHLIMKFLITPHKGYFVGYDYEINIIAPKQYPYSPFIVQSEKKVFHPNIDQISHTLYMEELEFKKWNPSLSLYMLVLKVKWLFIEPKINYIPENSHDCCLMYIYDKEEFRQQLYNQARSCSSSNNMESEDEQQSQQSNHQLPWSNSQSWNVKMVENISKNFRPISCIVNKKKRIMHSTYNYSMILSDYLHDKIKVN